MELHGESSTLSTEEKKYVISFVVNKVNKRISVIAGTGSNNTKEAIEMSKFAQNANVDGLLLVTPYYNKTTQIGLYEHFKLIASNVEIPIILYNVPSRTGVNISLDTLIKLSKIKNICGIKEASNDISQIAQIASKIPEDFYIYSGNDDQILPVLSLGGVGVISVLANILPKETHEICYSFFNGEIDKSRTLQLKYMDLIKKLVIEVNPIPIKEAMNILELNVGNCRPPLCNMENKNKVLICIIIFVIAAASLVAITISSEENNNQSADFGAFTMTVPSNAQFEQINSSSEFAETYIDNENSIMVSFLNSSYIEENVQNSTGYTIDFKEICTKYLEQMNLTKLDESSNSSNIEFYNDKMISTNGNVQQGYAGIYSDDNQMIIVECPDLDLVKNMTQSIKIKV